LDDEDDLAVQVPAAVTRFLATPVKISVTMPLTWMVRG
jgi:hypothetical protein